MLYHKGKRKGNTMTITEERTYFKIESRGEMVGALWGKAEDALLWLQKFEGMIEPYYSDNAGRIRTHSGNLTKFDLVEYVP